MLHKKLKTNYATFNSAALGPSKRRPLRIDLLAAVCTRSSGKRNEGPLETLDCVAYKGLPKERSNHPGVSG